MRVLVLIGILVSGSVWAKDYATPLPQEKQIVLEKFMLNWSNKVGRKNAKRIFKSDSPERRAFLLELRQSLKALGLKAPTSDTDITVRTPCIIGFVDDPDCFSGVDITEKGRRYCLPCIEPQNMTLWSIDKKDKLFLPKFETSPPLEIKGEESSAIKEHP